MIDRYAYEYAHDDFYCYPGSNVLKNRLGITQMALFHDAERQITSLRTAQLLQSPPEGKMDFSYLKELHRRLFGDIYEWAGKVRTVNISKGSRFCEAVYIEEQMTTLMRRLEEEKYLADLSREALSRRLAYYIGEINAIHPFREGNGRTQRMFITILAYRNGYRLDLQNVDAQSMYEASVRTFYGEYALMERMFLDNLHGL